MGCLFCRLAAGEIASDIVHQDDAVTAFRDVNPQAPTHILIVPRKHIATLNDATEADEPLLGRIERLAAQLAAREGIAEEGYRTVYNCNRGAGQSVFHLHLHLLGGRAMGWPPG